MLRNHPRPNKKRMNAHTCSLFSRDDKAYLRRGTDVGMRDAKSEKVYDVSDKEKKRKLPQQDFSNPQVHITPSSFRIFILSSCQRR